MVPIESECFAHVNTAVGARTGANQFLEPKSLIETVSGRVPCAHAEMHARRTAGAQLVEERFNHLSAVAAALRTRQQINVQVRRI